MDQRLETVIAVFIDQKIDIDAREESLSLLEACALDCIATFYQMIQKIQLKTYMGSGKAIEIQEYILDHPVDYVYINQNLSALQIKNLELLWNTKVLDHSDLILKIFQKRANTQTSILQVECAKLKRELPRLIGSNTHLSRQSGSGLNKGSGEKQLELDRRRISTRIHELERELKKIKKQRATQRKNRIQSRIPYVSLIGYTNAGKSTIMNQLLKKFDQKQDKQVLQKDMLFATLDTSTRMIEIPHGKSFILSDTVGFINNLPHELIQAFRSTLEEIQYADLLLEVVNINDPQKDLHMKVTRETLDKINASHIPIITLYNQCDRIDMQYPKLEQDSLFISAYDDASLNMLIDTIFHFIHPKIHIVSCLIPYVQTNLISKLYNLCDIQSIDHQEDGIHVSLEIHEEYLYLIKEYIVKAKYA